MGQIDPHAFRMIQAGWSVHGNSEIVFFSFLLMGMGMNRPMWSLWLNVKHKQRGQHAASSSQMHPWSLNTTINHGTCHRVARRSTLTDDEIKHAWCSRNEEDTTRVRLTQRQATKRERKFRDLEKKKMKERGRGGLLRKSVSSRPLAETRRTSSFPCTMFVGSSFLPRSHRCREIQRLEELKDDDTFPLAIQQVMAHIKKVFQGHVVHGRPVPAWQLSINYASCQSASHFWRCNSPGR